MDHPVEENSKVGARGPQGKLSASENGCEINSELLKALASIDVEGNKGSSDPTSTLFNKFPTTEIGTRKTLEPLNAALRSQLEVLRTIGVLNSRIASLESELKTEKLKWENVQQKGGQSEVGPKGLARRMTKLEGKVILMDDKLSKTQVNGCCSSAPAAKLQAAFLDCMCTVSSFETKQSALKDQFDHLASTHRKSMDGIDCLMMKINAMEKILTPNGAVAGVPDKASAGLAARLQKLEEVVEKIVEGRDVGVGTSLNAGGEGLPSIGDNEASADHQIISGIIRHFESVVPRLVSYDLVVDLLAILKKYDSRETTKPAVSVHLNDGPSLDGVTGGHGKDESRWSSLENRMLCLETRIETLTGSQVKNQSIPVAESGDSEDPLAGAASGLMWKIKSLAHSTKNIVDLSLDLISILRKHDVKGK